MDNEQKQRLQRKANLVKLDGELMTGEAAIAKWESNKDTCDLYFVSNKQDGELITNPVWHTYEATIGKAYQLRAKPLKQVSWKGSREDVIALLTELGFINAGDI